MEKSRAGDGHRIQDRAGGRLGTSIPDTMSLSCPGLPCIIFQPDAWSNSSIPDLSSSLDKPLNLVQLLLDPQL